jgi:glycerol-3-phosphate dehydrogenase
VVHVTDVVLRRTNLAFMGGLTREHLEEISQALGAALGWSAQQARADADACSQTLRDEHRVELEEPAHTP